MSVINKLHLDGQKSLMAIVLFFLLYPGLGFSQTQPLSRNDKAQIEKSTASYSAANDAGNWKEASRHLNDIAYLHWEHNDYRKAIEYYEESLLLNDKLNNENGLAMLHNNLGMLYSDIGEYEKSLSYFEKTLAARRAFKNKEGIIAAIKNISVAQNNLGMYQESIDLLQEATLIARETNDPDQTSSCFMMLSEAYEKAGDVANTKHYYELYRSFQGMKQGKELERLQQLTDKDSILNQIKELESRK
ncbi:MAG: tetratricopeptide repeat protein, partial [Saprospiraceae bacterium]|nr:tetratricopeptide repeat protein [Saprospiraceae bacterium]